MKQPHADHHYHSLTMPTSLSHTVVFYGGHVEEEGPLAVDRCMVYGLLCIF